VLIKQGRNVQIKQERHNINPWRHSMAGERHGNGVVCELAFMVTKDFRRFPQQTPGKYRDNTPIWSQQIPSEF
jgi:hypothetical protein